MKGISLFWLLLLTVSRFCGAQDVFDPDDEIVRYDRDKPVGSREHPDTSLPGLQKWVSTPTIGVSVGTDTFDASSFKQYFINVNGSKLAFRIKYPYSFKNPDSAGKKYPINLFLHGGGEVGCPTNGGIYNNEKPLWLGGKLFMERVDKNQFDGFLLYPQLIVTEGCFLGWGTAASSNYLAILAMIDSMATYIRADVDRLVVDGLSGGGYGAWRMASGYPKRVAKIMPSASAGGTSNRNAFVHIPIWFATGGKDPDPSPEQAQSTLTKMKEIGADIRYTVYPERGHSVWYQHWREPDFVGAMNDVHKANPLVFFQRSEFCNEAEVNAKLGLTPGFYAYEWQKDGSTIATSTNGTNAVTDTASVESFSGNEITVKLYGSYRARFMRTSTSQWSDWSLKPALITTKGNTQTLPIEVSGKRSKVLAALDGSTTVPLTLSPGFINYQWYRISDDSLVSTSQIFDAPVGFYKARYEEEYGCGTAFSPEFRVVDANGTPKPDAPANVTAVPQTQSAIKLNWTQGAGETGFEVYRSATPGGPYEFVSLVDANAITFRDTGLVKNTLYYYKLRSVNETGASAPANEAAAKTLVDNTPPTAPSALAFTISTKTAVRLTWKISTDNEKVARYDIFVNGLKLYSVPESGYVVSGLDSLIPYNFIVKAVDAAGNISPPSNQVTFIPAGTPPGNKPGPPSEPVATAISYNKIEITWKDTTGNETAFEVVRSSSVNGTYVPIGTVNANVTSFSDSALAPSTKYYYRIRSVGAYGESVFSAKVNATTLSAPDTPESPPQLSGEAASNGSVSLMWNDESGNETSYKIYRSTDTIQFVEIATLPANSNAYTDSDVTGFATYYYYVVGVNNAGSGEKSNTLQIRAGNNPPVISSLENITLKAGSSAVENFTVSDDAGDIITVSLQGNPSFITLNSAGNNSYNINASPPQEEVGTYDVTVLAKDNNGKSSSQKISVIIGDPQTRSIYVNFGTPGKEAPSPWNNWLGVRNSGDVITGLKDENNSTTNISVTTINGWTETTDVGHITGNNSGVFPDAVLASGLADTGEAKQIKFSGLNPAKVYNLVFAGSKNEGIMASSQYSSSSGSSTLNARYNTNQTANLNSLVPDINGEVVVTISRTEGSPHTYLNGLVIQEYDPSILLLNPNNLYAEVVNRTTVRLTWSDRTNNETSADGYEVVRASDSLFTKDLVATPLPGNSNAYTNTGLNPDTKYWYRVRAKGSANYSAYSKRISAITPGATVYVNFNTTVTDAASPWNNLTSPPLSNFTTPLLKDQSGRNTKMALTLETEFNGEFTAGMNTGNNSGVVPDYVLMSNYWLDRGQLSQFRLSGLNHSKRYSIGFIGSSGPVNWFKGNYTATYTVNEKTVYLNSWENTSKIVYISNLAPATDGNLMLNFSTTPEGGYGFNAGIIIHEYTHTNIQAPDTSQNTPPVDTIPDNPPVDTIPDNPPPVDTIPDNPPPVDTIPDNPPPVDTIPDNPPPVDTIPDNPPPVDTIPDNPPPVDTIPDSPPPVDTIPDIPPPVDTTGNNPPIDSIPEEEKNKVTVYPNPFLNIVLLSFYNKQATDRISVEIHDPHGRLVYRQDFGTRSVGQNLLLISGFSANMRTGIYIATLRANGKSVKSLKVIKIRY